MNCKKILALLLAAALLLASLCGCGYNPETVLDVDGYEFPAGVYLALQLQALNSAVEALGQSYYYTIDILDDPMEDGRTVREYVNDRTVELCREYVFVEREYERLALETTESDTWYLDYMTSYYWQSYSTNYMNNGVAFESFKTLYTNNYKRSAVLSTLYGPDGDRALSDEEKLAYYLEHFTRADYIEFPTADESGLGLTSEATQLLSGIANEMLETAKTKDSLEAAYLAHYDQVYALTNSALTANAENYAATVTADSVVSDLTGSFDEEFVKMLLSMNAGEYGVYDSGKAIYLFCVKGTDAQDTALSEYDAYIVDGAAAEPFAAYVSEGAAAYTVKEDARARKYYAPDNIKISNTGLFG